MTRDAAIQHVFEVADDSLQGLLGYYLYVVHATECAEEKRILTKLPEKQMPMTHEWDRHYDPHQLIQVMKEFSLIYHTRVALVAMVNIFEGTTRSFLQRLEDAKLAQNVRDKGRSFKSRLEWVFQKVTGSSYGNESMQGRIPQLCLDVDHARRLRNISVHNNGLFDDNYETDAIAVGNRPPLLHPGFQRFDADKNKPQPLLLHPEDYIALNKSHLELLHFLHHEIQKQDFGDDNPYDYRKEGKRLEWHRLLVGF